ncbi:leucine Rich repeat-containing domain protein [Ancylostoma duodenale]|uniref:Leucine Rich repeat-containing domain protein n=1 Tax=Ancylostoma duodenale TaxID=51022 RepID=A0A0C2H4E0_9BILA|nr:leucine Rich repeat-containing domain protein [Ancylostoma duodenale]
MFPKFRLLCRHLQHLEKDNWIGLDSLQEIDLGWNEIRDIPADVFSSLAENLTSLNLRHNPLKTVPSTGLKNLHSLFLSECPLTEIGSEQLKDYPKLETFDVSKCNLTSLPADTFANQKDSLKTLHLERNKLTTLDPKPYDEKLDTTTALPTTTSEAEPTTPENTTPLTLPNLFVGARTNETLFKEEPRREVYDINKANDPKDAMEQHDGEKSYAMHATILVIAIVSAIAIVAVGMFMRNRRKIASEEETRKGKKVSKLEDGMVEIELDSSTPHKR